MAERLPVRKTYKLYVGGKFPAPSRGGRMRPKDRTWRAPLARTHATPCAQRAQHSPAGQVRRRTTGAKCCTGWPKCSRPAPREFAGLCTGREEVERSVDRIVWYAGWADKLAQVIGSSNPVAGPYFNFTVPEPTGVVAVLAPEEPPLLGLVTRLAPAIVGGNAAVVVAS